MTYQYFAPYSSSGSLGIYDYGSPSDLLDDVGFDAYSGYASSKVFDGKDGATLIGSSNADLMHIDRRTAVEFVGVTAFHGEGGNDVIYLGSKGTSYGAAHLYGDGGSDLLVGNDGNDVEYGGIGDDRLFGFYGRDALDGGDGDDILDGGNGADKLVGGAGSDTASYLSANHETGVLANLTNARYNTGDAQGDTYNGIENLTGSHYDDTLYGDAGNNVLTGSTGRDVLTGGAGADSFAYTSATDSTTISTGRDLIRDFSTDDHDVIDLSHMKNGYGDVGGFTFIGFNDFHGHGAAGQVNASYSGNYTLINLDNNGDGKADFQITLSGHISLSSSDFKF